MALGTDRREKISPASTGAKALAALAMLSFAASAGAARGQTPDAPAAGQNPSGITTLKATVRRVGVDMVVTDQGDRPVSGLTIDDFSVQEDNAPQPVRTFAFHTGSHREPSAGLTAPSLPPNTFLNAGIEPEAETAVVIFFDASTMSWHDGQVAKGELLRYLEQRRAHPFSPPVAIFVLGRSTRLSLLQGFTEQRALPELDRGIERARLETPPFWRAPNAPEPRFEALKRVARFLAPVSGRKMVVWYGAYFPHSGMVRFGSTVVATLDLTDETRQFLDFMNLNHVTIYPVDVLGVRINTDRPKSTIYGSPVVMMSDHQDFTYSNGERVQAANALAEATGGHAFYGTNDLAGAVDQAIADGSTYYSLTYEPTNPKYDGSLRHIKVTLKKPGYNLSYRKTYYADDLNAVARAAADAPESPLSPALERGTPLDHGLFVEAHLDATGPPVAATPEQMRVLAQFGAMRDRAAQAEKKSAAPAPPVMMQPYTISLALIARQLELPANDSGAHLASLEFGVIAYDEEGRKLNGLDTRIDDPLPAERYAKVAAEGYRAAQTVAVPVTATSLRLAVRDVKSNRVGSLEVKLPLAKTDEVASETKR